MKEERQHIRRLLNRVEKRFFKRPTYQKLDDLIGEVHPYPMHKEEVLPIPEAQPLCFCRFKVLPVHHDEPRRPAGGNF
ncbi:MAG: hypothetical protein PWQ39_1447 [Thermacetogenium sp.]|nr:hypothetical protein [Thermacetogenium sp.]